MSVARLIVLATAVTMVVAFTASASDELGTLITFTIPELEGSISAIDLADVDGDGFPEVLATDNHKLVLYSAKDDEVLLSLDIDLFYAANGYGNCTTTYWGYISTSYSDPFAGFPARVLLADVNHDDYLDALLLTQSVCTQNSATRYIVTMFDRVLSGSAPEIAFEKSFSTRLTIGAFDAVDWDGDGYDNLVISIDSVDVNWPIPGAWNTELTSGLTLAYSSFPSTEIAHWDIMICSLAEIPREGDQPFLATSKLAYNYEDLPTFAPFEYTTGVMMLVEDGQIPPSLYPWVSPYSCDDFSWSRSTTTIREIGCIGNISGEGVTPEVLNPYHWSWHCSNDDYANPETIDSSGAILILSRVFEVDSVVNVWHVDVTGHNYQSLLYHPDFPGAFFAIEADTLFRFDGTDGSIAEHYQTLPDGLHMWDYPWPDRPYLVTVDGAAVTYQSFDIATEVDSPSQPDILPGSFTLGTPYPNPFNPTVAVPVTMSRRGHLQVEVFNSLGQRVDVVCNREMPAGEMTLDWDGSRFSSGIYLFRATAGAESRTVKAMLLK